MPGIVDSFCKVLDVNGARKVDPKHPRDPGLAGLFGFGARTKSGLSITSDNATEVAAVMACVKVIVETLSSVPLVLYEIKDNGSKSQAIKSPLYNILRWQPNRWQTAVDFFEMTAGHVALRGNAYAEILTNNANQVTDLVPLHPDRVTPFFAPDGRRAYEYQDKDKERRVILQDEMLHIALMSFDGLKGMNPIQQSRETIGTAKAAQIYGARFFSNDSRPAGYLKHPATLSQEAQERLINSWESRHRGVDNAHRPAILEEGMEWESVGIAPEDAQYLDTRKFEKTEIASIFRVPPHMIADLERATFSNIEQQSLNFIYYTMLPWFNRIQQAVRRDLISPANKTRLYAKFNPETLLRGDQKTRYDSYAQGRSWGWLSANDVREMEDMDPLPDAIGNTYLQPSNHVTTGKFDDDEDQQSPQPNVDADALLPVLHAACERIVNKEIKAIRRAVQAKAAPDWLDVFYDEHQDFVQSVLGVSAATAKLWCDMQHHELLAGKNMDLVFDDWQDSAASRLMDIAKEDLHAQKN